VPLLEDFVKHLKPGPFNALEIVKNATPQALGDLLKPLSRKAFGCVNATRVVGLQPRNSSPKSIPLQPIVH
jgi:hypothetical protein